MRWVWIGVGLLLAAGAVLSKERRSLPADLGAPVPADFDPVRAGFRVQVAGLDLPYRVFALYVQPGEDLRIAVDSTHAGAFGAMADGGRLADLGTRRWQWKAPEEAGLYHVTIVHLPSNESVLLNCFVLVPYAELRGGQLNGYRIGRYPRAPAGDADRSMSPRYAPPVGFVEVTPENQLTRVSPHFRLRQFLCKQVSDFPKYLVLKERLVLKLEYLLEGLNARGIAAESLHVMSGYRTPYYNEAIDNVKYSRHQWGEAADVFVDDRPANGVMDDLNGDGRVDTRDAGVLHAVADELDLRADLGVSGGLGMYGTNAAHGPFVHVDIRGRRARW